MKAIVYTTSAGHNGKYAKLLEKITDIPAYSHTEAIEKVPNSAEILYMGWIAAGKIKGLSKAKSRYKVKTVCAVGMGTPGGGQEALLKKRNDTGPAESFYLQGGYEISLLHG